MAALPPPGRTLPPGARPPNPGREAIPVAEPGAKKVMPTAAATGPTESFIPKVRPQPLAGRTSGTVAGPTPKALEGKGETKVPGKLDTRFSAMPIPGMAGPGGVARQPTFNPSATVTGVFPVLPVTPKAGKPGASTPSSPELRSSAMPRPSDMKKLDLGSKDDTSKPADLRPFKLPPPQAAAPSGDQKKPATTESPAIGRQPPKGPAAGPAVGRTPNPLKPLTSQSSVGFGDIPENGVSVKPVFGKHPSIVTPVTPSTPTARPISSVVLEPPRRMTKDVRESAQAPRPVVLPPPIPHSGLQRRDQAMAAPPVMAPRPADDEIINETKEQKRERMRKKVAVEMMDTERSYVDSLKQLNIEYIEPLRTAANTAQAIVTDKECNCLFSNIGQIQELNNKFLADLSKRIEGWTPLTCVCDLVRDFAPYFKMYTQYVSNYSTASDLLLKLDKNAAFQAFVENVLSKGHGALAFYLIMPIQRIPRYKLLLLEIQKVTDDTHPDKKACDEAVETVSSVATHINNAVKAHESRQKIMEIQSNFAGSVDFVSPSRRFIRQGQLTKICRSSLKAYTFFCFNDLLVYADVKSVALGTAGVKRFKLHRQIPIDGSFGIQDMSDDAKYQHRFTIINAQKSFVVFAPNKEEKAQWFKDLTTCMSEFRKATKTKQLGDVASGGHIAPVWQTDSSAKACQCCKTAFSVLRRRHHCRYCGSLVCESCSTKRMRVNANKQPLRVCDQCVARIKGDVPKNLPAAQAPEAPDGKETSTTKGSSMSGGGEYNDVESDDEQEENQEGVKAIALHTFEAIESNDLAFQQGDTIWVTNQKDPGWWEGTMNGKSGVFPANYVAIEGVGPAVESVPVDFQAFCKTAYTAQNTTELSMIVGDSIHCTARESMVGANPDGVPDEWFYGCNARTSAEGWFPGHYVEVEAS